MGLVAKAIRHQVQASIFGQNVEAGVKFKANAGSIEQIKFDKKTSILLLPLIILNVEIGVFIRNLVAFEMCSPNYRVYKFKQYAQFISNMMYKT